MTKQEFFNLMGWCECDVCGTRYTDWELYANHMCTHSQGVRMTQQSFRWDITDDDTTGTV